MSKGGDDPKMKVTEYFISAHYGVCMGPVDEVTDIWYGEKKLWGGSVTANQTLQVTKRNLFGGEKVEGGFRGFIDVLLGGPTQLASEDLTAGLVRNGATGVGAQTDAPGYRGILSFYIYGQPLSLFSGS